MSRAIAVVVTSGQVIATWRNWIGGCLAGSGAAVIAGPSGLSYLLFGATLAPVVALVVWSQVGSTSFERWYAGPARRRSWRRRVRADWPRLMRRSGLASQRHTGRRELDPDADVPTLRKVRAHGSVLKLTIETMRGQTIEELAFGAPKLASALKARTFRVRPAEGPRAGYSLVVELVMRDNLASAAPATPLKSVAYDAVQLGRSQSGGIWNLVVRGRHTLVAGCSGAGKGSVLWGLCCGLAPAVGRDIVRLWGVDLKRGVELEMGASLFTARAYTAADAVEVLKALLAVIDERGRHMAGQTRLHEPTPGDPLHVLVVDELAALTAYSEVTIRREAERLLSEILTQGRALGVVVLACVQDPRKDVVPVRSLFTQTIALRLRSVEETVMVLGDAAASTAPAHLISPRAPGTGWIVDDTGAVDRVRAHYWTDTTIREVAASCPSPVTFEIPEPARPQDDLDDLLDVRRPRSPRRPRAALVAVTEPDTGDPS